MNINERIDWKGGMEISAQTFLELDAHLGKRQEVAIRTVNGKQFGLLPFTEFRNRAGIVRNKVEIENLSCMALLPSGKVLHIEEKVELDIPLVYGEVYYMACEFSTETLHYDVHEVPFVRPQYVYGIYTREEMEGTDRFPVLRFIVREGVFSIDEDYIQPCLFLSSDPRFQNYIDRLGEKLEVLAGHDHLENGEGKRSLRFLLFVLRNFSMDSRVERFIQFTQELAQTVEFYIVRPDSGQDQELPSCSPYDIVLWLDWLEGYLTTAASILDRTEPVASQIDIEELKSQLKTELYEELYAELKGPLYNDLKDQLQLEISEDVKTRLTEYLDNRLQEDLHGLVSGELSEELYQRLYGSLYEAVYNALYVPEQKEEEKEFTPLI